VYDDVTLCMMMWHQVRALEAMMGYQEGEGSDTDVEFGDVEFGHGKTPKP